MAHRKGFYERFIKRPQDFILSLGGGAADNRKLMDYLKENGRIIYLRRDEEDMLPVILKHGVPPFLDPDDIKGSFHRVYCERDRKYTQLSTERIRYKTRSGMDTKGLLSRLMEKLNDENALPVLEDAIESTGLDAADSRSLYERSAPERLADGEREIVERRVIQEGIGKAFLEAIEAQVSSEEIDRYVLSAIGNRKEITTEDFPVGTIEEFVLFILATVRNGEKDAPYIMDESSGKDVTMPKGTVLPFVRARRKHGIQR